MRDVPGYVDISTEDFRMIYHLAHGHALERLFRHVSARNLMRTGIVPLHPETKLDAAARTLVAQDPKGLPVVDVDRSVIGMLTDVCPSVPQDNRRRGNVCPGSYRANDG